MVSIVIPAYNVEAYLGECLDTVMVQTYGDIEVIVVNDGSPDAVGEIARSYADRDGRIRYYEKANGGLSDARNFGMQYATGDYVFFLDSDDYIAPDAIERLVDFAQRHDCDVVQGGHYYLYDDHLEYDDRWLAEGAELVLSARDSISALIDNTYLKNFAWGKLYRREVIQGLLFPKGRFFEDSYWQYLVAHRAKRYGVLNVPLCYYRQRPASISGTASDRILDLLKGDEGRMAFVKEHFAELEPKAVRAYWHMLFDICYGSDSQAKRAYWDYAMTRYAGLLQGCLKSDIYYRLSHSGHHRAVAALRFGRRVYDHFFAKRLKRIEK